MNTRFVSLQRSLLASGLFVATLTGFVIATIAAMLVTATSDGSTFFFDLIFHTFPVACPKSTPDNLCVTIARGWNDSWSFVVWGTVATAYGVLVRNRPLAQRLLVALLLIPVIILLMQLAMSVFGFREFIDTL